MFCFVCWYYLVKSNNPSFKKKCRFPAQLHPTEAELLGWAWEIKIYSNSPGDPDVWLCLRAHALKHLLHLHLVLLCSPAPQVLTPSSLHWESSSNTPPILFLQRNNGKLKSYPNTKSAEISQMSHQHRGLWRDISTQSHQEEVQKKLRGCKGRAIGP